MTGRGDVVASAAKQSPFRFEIVDVTSCVKRNTKPAGEKAVKSVNEEVRKNMPYIGVFLAITLLLVNASPIGAWEGKVVGIGDGDTVRVMHRGTAEKIRLYAIDCPERGQDFGTRASQFTSEMVFGKTVTVEPVDKDRYGRTVAWVSVDGKSLNKALVGAGLAWWYRFHAPDNRELAKLEEDARNDKRGLWSLPNPVPPWKFRRSNRDRDERHRE
jgi:micrococcal nuclease